MQQSVLLQQGLSPQAAAAGAAGLAGAHPMHVALWPRGHSPAGEASESADARYAELLARLQTFMPALRAAADGDIDFETTWQLLKVLGGGSNGICIIGLCL
jgi:hypothetical protein